MNIITPVKSEKEILQPTELILDHPPVDQLPRKQRGVLTGSMKYIIVLLGMGVMIALALPDLVGLGCAGKPRDTYGKNGLGTINRAQQGFYFENGAFAANLVDLGLVNLAQKQREYTQDYRFVMKTASSRVYALAIPQNPMETGIKSFSSAVQFNEQSQSYETIICMSNKVVETPDIPIIEKEILICPDSMVKTD